MVLSLDVGTVDNDEALDLAQFEPDPDGEGGRETAPPAAEPDAGDPQWVVWPDAADEAAWALEEQSAWTTR